MCEWNGGGDFLTPRTKMLCNSSKPALPSVHMDLWENKRVNERTRWSILEADVVNECPPGVTDFVAALEVTGGLGWSSGQAFRNLLVFFIYEGVMLWNSLSLPCCVCCVLFFVLFLNQKGKCELTVMKCVLSGCQMGTFCLAYMWCFWHFLIYFQPNLLNIPKLLFLAHFFFSE